MKKKIVGALVILLGLVAERVGSVLAILLILAVGLSAGKSGAEDRISQITGVDASVGNKVWEYDTHGGFHGDGTSCVILKFSDEKILWEIRKASLWQPFPLNETVRTLVYGVSDDARTDGPYLTDREGDPLVPEIGKGFYLLVDRHSEAGTASAPEEILGRGSYNFSLALYDEETNMLYFCELDS